MKYEKSCGCIVVRLIDNKKKILIIRQNDGNWYIPKGHVEGSESEEETAIREVKEETGIDIKIVPGFRNVINYTPADNVSKDVVFFIGKYISGTEKIQEEELLELKWCTYDEAVNLLTYNQNKAVLENAKKYIEKI